MSALTEKNGENTVSPVTIDALARSIFKEACKYGFGHVDIIRLINSLMDLCSSGVSTELGIIGGSTDYLYAEPEHEVSLPVRGPKLLIREFEGEKDQALLDAWLPDRYGRYFFLSGATSQRITVEGLTSSPNNHLGMVALADGTTIGAMAYLDHSHQQQRAELRKLIGDPNYRGKGLAEEATRMWVNYGVNGLGLKKIYVSTLQTQIANIKLNESIGFEVEGLLRNEVFIDGKRHDVLRMGISVD